MPAVTDVSAYVISSNSLFLVVARVVLVVLLVLVPLAVELPTVVMFNNFVFAS